MATAHTLRRADGQPQVQVTAPDRVATVDFDLHGLVGVRVVDATPRDLAIVRGQLGPLGAGAIDEPDIVVRFVDRLAVGSTIRYLGLEDAGFTDDAFLILRSKHARAKVQLDFDRIGRRLEIVCERGLPAVPLLIAIVNLTALAKGALPLHASAFTIDGTGVLVTGWAKGGKTEALLGFMLHGAEYVGDEWVYLSADGQQMYGIPEPIRVWDWHLRHLPRYWNQLSRADRLRLRGLRAVVGALGWAGTLGPSSTPGRRLSKLTDLLARQQFVHLPPRQTFGGGFGALTGRPDKLFFVASHASSEVVVEPIGADEIAQRMVYSLEEERADLLSYYRKFRFAFPDRSNPLLECVEQIQRDALYRVLDGKPAWAAYHPYPVDIPALYRAMRQVL